MTSGCFVEQADRSNDLAAPRRSFVLHTERSVQDTSGAAPRVSHRVLRTPRQHGASCSPTQARNQALLECRVSATQCVRERHCMRARVHLYVHAHACVDKCARYSPGKFQALTAVPHGDLHDTTPMRPYRFDHKAWRFEMGQDRTGSAKDRS
jgi:hypothetical protein